MRINIALEWFLNPDHLPFIAGVSKGFYERVGLDVRIIVPSEHYDGLEALKNREIEFAVNEPLHLIEQFSPDMLSLGSFFETRGGVMLSRDGERKLLNGEKIRISSPVSNDTTDKIAIEILTRYAAKSGVILEPSNVWIEEAGFYHIANIKSGYDGAWLVFFNFEGVEAIAEGLDTVLIDSAVGGFANFSALDIFTTKSFFERETDVINGFIAATKEAMVYIAKNRTEAREIYYDYSGEERSKLTDEIIDETLKCFNPEFVSSAKKQRETLEFFRELGITNLTYNELSGAFLG